MPAFPWQASHAVWHDVSRLLLAYVLALPVGWHREQQFHTIGLRTFPLVAIASCGYILLSTAPGMGPDAQSRIIQGLVAGIGFIGGGAILKDGATVHGAATAASIWNTGVIGAAVALGKYDIACILAVLNGFTLLYLGRLKRRLAEADTAELPKKS